MNQDDEHLRLLSIFHYVVAGLVGLFALFPLIHLVMGIAMLSGSFQQLEGPDARLIGCAFVILASVFMLFGFTFSALVALAGKYLARRQKYMYCLVIACITCTFMPFGTVLGVFTIVVLNRDSVKQSFGQATASGQQSGEATPGV